MSAIDALKKIVHQLRTRCPWDMEQTPKSIAPHIIEEAYELVDAIESDEPTKIIDELSDQLLHVVMIAEMMSETGAFDFEDVANHCTKKMIRRHPHVFGNDSAKTAHEVNRKWEEIKAKETPKESIVDGIPTHLPALLHAQKIQRTVAQVGFDWPNITGPIEKLTEECQELLTAINNDHIDEEIGDILFTIVNICRKSNKSAEDLLQRANQKFKQRFKLCEILAKNHGTPINNLSLKKLESLWDQAKKLQK